MLNSIGRLGFGQRGGDLAEWFRALLDDMFEKRTVDCSLADAGGARAMADKRWCGKPLYDCVPDAFVVATASARGLTVVTRDTG